MFLWFELFSLVVQFYQLGFSMEFFNSIGLLAFLDKIRATKMSIDPIKLNFKELEPKKHATDFFISSGDSRQCLRYDNFAIFLKVFLNFWTLGRPYP